MTPERRLLLLLVASVAVFVVGVVFFRGTADDDDAPVAGDTTTSTTTEEASAPAEDTTTTSPAVDLPPLQRLEYEILVEGISQPSTINAIEGDDRLFVAQRFGVISILDPGGEMLETPFLDITDRVLARGIEQGLLGFEFHPDYETNGLFYVYYTDQGGRRQLSEFQVFSSDPDRAQAASERVIIELEQPPDSTDIRHYGGQVTFGPDGYLWLSMGDGADSRQQGQDPNTMFGSIIRIDVDNGDPYAIPPDNPFVDGGGAEEVWAYGLRNPWRFSIDEQTGLVYIADVGHSDQEEVNVVPIEAGGLNFGWSDIEGTRCFHAQPCDPELYTPPVITYRHDQGCSITGGYVYRGSEIPEFDGVYFYSDWCGQWLRSFDFVDGRATDEQDFTEELGQIGQVNSFAIGGDGELYLVTHNGNVAKLTAVR